MNKYMMFAGLLVVASIVMYVIGADSSHLSELKDFFWVPLPLAAVLFFYGKK